MFTLRPWNVLPTFAKIPGRFAVTTLSCTGRLIFAFASHLLIKLAFPGKTAASNSLLILGLAFAVLACTYLAIQYMLAVRRTWFLVLLAVVAIAEPVLLLNASHQPRSFATVVLAIQAVGALVAFTCALRPDRRAASPPGPPERVAEERVPEPV